jgi:epoxyqueuosine reductase
LAFFAIVYYWFHSYISSIISILLVRHIVIVKNQDAVLQEDLSGRVEDTVREFCRVSPDNNMNYGWDERAVDEPLMGYSSGGDPLYIELQKDIGPPFMTPAEIFNRSFPRAHVSGDELTIICIVLPKTQHTREDNRKETAYPSERWIRSKHFGGEFGKKLCAHLVKTLGDVGYEAVAPGYVPFFTIGKSGKYGLASTWSERHAAYVSGLGTFGLCDGLITEKGKAMQCYSVIVRATMPPTHRPYEDHHAHCLFYARGTCGLCIKRCPAEAISEKGHDKERCAKHCFGVAQPYARSRFGIDDYGCGLCQTGVPCESGNPLRASAKKESRGN